MIAIEIVVEKSRGGGPVVAGEVWQVVVECSGLNSMVTMTSGCVYKVFFR